MELRNRHGHGIRRFRAARVLSTLVAVATCGDGRVPMRSRRCASRSGGPPVQRGAGRGDDLRGRPLRPQAGHLPGHHDFQPGNAFDGDDATEWSSRGDGDSGFIAVDLGEATEIGAVELVTRSMADGSAITDTSTVSIDGGAPQGPFPAGTPARLRIAELVGSGRELPFDVETSSGGNVGASEIRVYAPA